MVTKIRIGFLVVAMGFVSFAWGNPQETNDRVRLQEKKQDSKQEIDTTDFMKRKLNAAREIVAGLSMEDFEKIGKNSQDLMLLSHESNWNVMQTETYLNMSRDFRGSAKRLRSAAKDKNLDGATLAYFEMTLNCVRCHKYIRDRRKSGDK